MGVRSRVLVMVAAVVVVAGAAGAAVWHRSTGVYRLARSGDPQRRRVAAETLAARSGPRADAALARLADDADLAVASAALRSLGRRDGEAARTCLRQCAAAHRSMPLRCVALGQLGRDPQTRTSRLVEATRSGPPGLRSAGAYALGWRNQPVAVAALLDALDDPDMGVRIHAAESLMRLAGGRIEFSPNAPLLKRQQQLRKLREGLLP